MMFTKHLGIRKGHDHFYGGLVVELGKYFGFYAFRCTDYAERPFLCATIWYRAGKNRLGYFHPSFRWF
jgi:hypothetical protein